MKAFIVGLPVFLLLDFVWLGIVARRFYAEHLDGWLRKSADGSMAPLWGPALAFYVLVVVGLLVFVAPRVEASGGSAVSAAGWGALFGVVVYSAWDLTNLAVLRDWPVPIVLADLAWGAVVCALTTTTMTVASR